MRVRRILHAPRNPLTSAGCHRRFPAMRFTVATYNIHKGFTQLNRRMVIHELRERLHGLAADILLLQEVVGVHRGHAARHRRLAGEAAARVHRRHGLARGRLRQERGRRTMAITATPCCRAFRSSRRRISTSPRTRSKAAACSTATIELGPGEPELHCLNVHLGLFERGRKWQIHALCETDPRDGARRRAAHHRRRLQRLAAQGEPAARRGARRRRGVRGRARASGAHVPVGDARLPPRSHLRARPRRSSMRTSTTRFPRATDLRSRGARRHVRHEHRGRDEPVPAGQSHNFVEERRRVLSGAGRRDRRRGARSLARDLHLRRRRRRRASSPPRSCRAAQRGIVVRVLVDGWGAQALPDRGDRARSSSRAACTLLKYRPEVAPWQFPLESVAAAAPQALPRRRQDRVRRRHQHHRRREHAGAEAAARRFRAAHRGSAARADRAHDAARLGDQRARAVPAERGAAVSRAAARAAGRRADGEIPDPRQPAPPPRHRARVPRRDPHREARDPDRQLVLLSRHPLSPRADRGGASAASR